MAQTRSIVLRADGSKRTIDQRRKFVSTRSLREAERLRKALLGDRASK